MKTNVDAIEGKTLPVFLYYSIPEVLGMLALSSAMIIDGLFLGNYVGAKALAAVNMVIPLGTLFFGISLMLSIGGSVISGKLIGEGNSESASSVFTKTVITILVFSLFSLVLGTIFLRDIIPLLGASESLIGFIDDYLSIILYFLPLHLCGISLSYFVRVDGRPVMASSIVFFSAGLNVFLNWIFIVELNMGVKGAALATGISESVIFAILLPYFIFCSRTLNFVWIKDGWKQIWLAAYNGFSEFANEISAGIVVFFINWIIIKRLGVSGVAAFSIVNYLFIAGLMICYGISESLQPLISKNFGAQQPKRISSFIRLSSISVLATGILIVAILLLVPDALINLFLKTGEKETGQIALEFISFFWPTFLFAGINITISVYFTAMQKPIHSAALAMSHSLILPVIFILTLPIFMGDIGVYIAIPLSEMGTFVLALILFIRNKPKKLVTLEYGQKN